MSHKTVTLFITLLTLALAGPSFSIPQIFTNETPLDDEFEQGTSRSYSSLPGLAGDFDTDSLTYKKAAQMMGQSAGPLNEFRVFYRTDAVAWEKTIDFQQAPASGDILDGTVNGTAISSTNFSVDGDTTLQAVAAKIAMIEGIDTAEVSGNTIIVTGVLEWEITLTSFAISGAHTQAATVATTQDGITQSDDITTAVTENKSWYIALSTSYEKGALLASAAAIQANERFAIFLTADTDTYTNVETDVLSLLGNLGYTRTSIWHTQDTAENLDGAIAGRCLPLPPGNVVFWGKTLTGVSATTLTENQQEILLNKFGNIYVEESGKNITKEGTMVNGGFMDIIRDTDFGKSYVILGIFDELTKADKLGFIDATISLIDARMNSDFKYLYNAGVIQNNYKTYPPVAADIPANIRATRKLPFDIPFFWQLQGATQAVETNGLVTV
jgi:hypothetical protein